ncbi:MAG TPA: hypothetical protein VFH26_06610 [Gemmatimonadales bacterium]|nr:hypothetical protein [Gemmatimonadales bacterium]
MLSCDYNGWTDLPEEEREAVEAFESAAAALAEPPPPLVILAQLPAPVLPRQKAA